MSRRRNSDASLNEVSIKKYLFPACGPCHYLRIFSILSGLKPSTALGGSTVLRIPKCELALFFQIVILFFVSENGDQGAIKQFSWVPQSLLQMAQSPEVRYAFYAAQALHCPYIVSPELPPNMPWLNTSFLSSPHTPKRMR